MTKITETLIRDIKDKIVEKIHPEKIILFGSHAHGIPNKGSDLDIVLIKESDLPRHKRAVEAYEVISPFGVPIDIIVYTPQEVEEYEDVKGAFINKVIRTGKTLYQQPGQEKKRVQKTMNHRDTITKLVWERFKKARSDLRDAEALIELDSPYEDIICLHSQQAAEKYSKGLLVFHQIEFEKTHSLVHLEDLCALAEPAFNSITSEIISLNPYAVAVSYPEDFRDYSLEDARDAIQVAQKLESFVLS